MSTGRDRIKKEKKAEEKQKEEDAKQIISYIRTCLSVVEQAQEELRTFAIHTAISQAARDLEGLSEKNEAVLFSLFMQSSNVLVSHLMEIRNVLQSRMKSSPDIKIVNSMKGVDELVNIQKEAEDIIRNEG